MTDSSLGKVLIAVVVLLGLGVWLLVAALPPPERASFGVTLAAIVAVTLAGAILRFKSNRFVWAVAAVVLVVGEAWVAVDMYRLGRRDWMVYGLLAIGLAVAWTMDIFRDREHLSRPHTPSA